MLTDDFFDNISAIEDAGDLRIDGSMGSRGSTSGRRCNGKYSMLVSLITQKCFGKVDLDEQL